MFFNRSTRQRESRGEGEPCPVNPTGDFLDPILNHPMRYGLETILLDPRTVISSQKCHGPSLIYHPPTVSENLWHGDCEINATLALHAIARERGSYRRVNIELLSYRTDCGVNLPHARCSVKHIASRTAIDPSLFFRSLNADLIIERQFRKDIPLLGSISTTRLDTSHAIMGEFEHDGAVYLTSIGLTPQDRGYRAFFTLIEQRNGAVSTVCHCIEIIDSARLSRAEVDLPQHLAAKFHQSLPVVVIRAGSQGPVMETLSDPFLCGNLHRLNGLVRNALIRGRDTKRVDDMMDIVLAEERSQLDS